MSDDFFSKKKTVVSYVLSVLILWIHIASFKQYGDWPDWQWTVVSVIQSLTVIAVPLYFFISAALFYRDYSNKRYFKKIKNRFFSLFIPLILWNTLNMIFYELLVHIPFLSNYVNRTEMIHSVKDVFLGIVYYNQFNGPFWFLSALIVMSLLAPVVNLLITNRIVGIIMILGAVFLCNTDVLMIFPSFHYNRVWIVYYLIGAYIGKHFWSWFQRRSDRKWIIAAAFCFAASWFYEIQTWIPNIYYVDILVTVVFSVSAWIMMDGLIDHMKDRKFLHHSFWVFALHMNVNSIIAKIAFQFLPKDWRAIIPNFIITTIGTLFVIEWITRFIERFLPRTYRVLSGNR